VLFQVEKWNLEFINQSKGLEKLWSWSDQTLESNRLIVPIHRDLEQVTSGSVWPPMQSTQSQCLPTDRVLPEDPTSGGNSIKCLCRGYQQSSSQCPLQEVLAMRRHKPAGATLRFLTLRQDPWQNHLSICCGGRDQYFPLQLFNGHFGSLTQAWGGILMGTKLHLPMEKPESEHPIRFQ
jgi:hypothetical protein